MQISSEILNALADALQKQHGFATKGELDRTVADILRRSGERSAARGPQLSITKLVRGIRAQQGLGAICEATKDADIAYAKTLTTGSTPGSYLVPTIQADDIVQMLETGGVARAAGARIWPMAGIQKMNVPTALSSPSWVWMAQGSQQTPTDPNLGQMSFDLKERRALVAIPNQLLTTSEPAVDMVIGELLGLAGAANEDTALFAASQVSGAPLNLYSQSGVTIVHANNNSANGGNLIYADILSVLQKASANKAKGPFVWFASPRTLYARIMGMLDLQSRPLYLPTYSQGLQTTGVDVGTVAPVGFLMGYPVFVSPYISETMAVGSGTNQSMLIFTNAKYVHIAESSALEIAISTERYFDSAETAIRATSHEDFGAAPAAGITILDGIN